MGKSRAADLYSRLEARGVSALNDLIADREAESLFLDFKCSADNGTGPRLLPDDSKNLSKSVSGFGNSSGGVVIWGVDCRQDRNGSEVSSKTPLKDANGFHTKLESALSRATIPPPADVHMLVLQEDPSQLEGYVAMHVPRSHQGPLRSVETKHYHMRAGSAFEIVPHDVLAGMFGRSPQPDVGAEFVPVVVSMGRGHDLRVFLHVIAVNDSSVIAERPYLSVKLGDFPIEDFSLSVKNNKDYVVRRGPLPSASVVAKSDVALAPGATEEICTFGVSIPRSWQKEINLICTIGAQGAAPRSFTLVAIPARIAGAVSRASMADLTLTSTDIFSIESN